MSESDYRVRDLAEIRLTLRADLAMRLEREAGEPVYIIEDKLQSKFFRVGIAEYSFIALLDGKTTVAEAVAFAARLDAGKAITEEQAAVVCRWLIDNQLACDAESPQSYGEVAENAAPSKSALARWNPLYLRVPLLRPDRWVTRLSPYVGWLFSLPAMIIAAIIMACGGVATVANWDNLVASTGRVFATDQWLTVGLAWVVIKFLHETAHALVCKRHGGVVRDAGVVFILGAPLAYVDVTSAWRFASKWQRIHTSAAGIYIELLIAAIAACGWSYLAAGAANDLCLQVMIMASISTILFNANPLMRFDGYYVLADLLEIPNLYQDSQSRLRGLAAKWLFGERQATGETGKRGLFLLAYGCGAFAWKWMVCVTIAVTVILVLEGLGVLLVMIGLTIWLGPSAGAFAGGLANRGSWTRPRRVKGIALLLVIVTSTLSVVLLAPWPFAPQAPAVVEYAPLAIVRASNDGFVRQVAVKVGQEVAQGQLLFRLENAELQLEVEQLRADLTEAENAVRALRFDAKTAESQSEFERLMGLRERLQEKLKHLKSLDVRSPINGTVVSGEPASLLGAYLREGDEVLVIGSEGSKELRLSIAQHDVEAYGEHVDQPLRIRVHGVEPFLAALTSVAPQATLEPRSPAFCATYGGPLPVITQDAKSDANEPQFRFVAPRFDATIALDRETSLRLLAGQRGLSTLASRRRSIANHLLIRLIEWIQAQRRQLSEFTV